MGWMTKAAVLAFVMESAISSTPLIEGRIRTDEDPGNKNLQDSCDGFIKRIPETWPGAFCRGVPADGCHSKTG